MEPRFIHLQLSIKIYNLRHYTNPAPLYLVLLSIKSPSMHTPEFSSVNVKLQSRITASYEPVKLNPSRPMPSRRKLLKNFFDVCHFYRLQTQFAEVMFSQVSVCPRGWGWGVISLCVRGPSWADTPFPLRWPLKRAVRILQKCILVPIVFTLSLIFFAFASNFTQCE